MTSSYTCTCLKSGCIDDSKMLMPASALRLFHYVVWVVVDKENPASCGYVAGKRKPSWTSWQDLRDPGCHQKTLWQPLVKTSQGSSLELTRVRSCKVHGSHTLGRVHRYAGHPVCGDNSHPYFFIGLLTENMGDYLHKALDTGLCKWCWEGGRATGKLR